MEIDVDKLSKQERYKLLVGAVVPRPIAWVSTLSKAGAPNLAPFSYFNAVAASPPTLMFSAGTHGQGRSKDTVLNAEATEEFVVNIVTETLAEAMNASSAAAPHGVSEFELAGVTPAPSSTVSAPRVGESPINFECRLLDIYRIGANSVVFGRVTHVHVAEELLLDGYKIDPVALKPVGRLAGTTYARVRDLFELERPE